jgi:uncharacterized membrane protein YeaQ/YmgE (transglycosylase-associated protein family)
MSDQLTAPSEPAEPDRPAATPTPTSRRTLVVQVVIGIAVLAGAGALAGVVWEWLWTPSVGVVVDHRVVAQDDAGLRNQFSATGWYVVVGTVAGLVAGAVVALFLDRVPLLTLVSVVVGSVLGGWLMIRVGNALGPPDPHHLALAAKDGTHLPAELTVSGRSPWIALPAGALVALALVFIGLSGVRGSRD